MHVSYTIIFLAVFGKRAERGGGECWNICWGNTKRVLGVVVVSKNNFFCNFFSIFFFIVFE